MQSPQVFCDFHHASLLNSFIMLFEGRLGGNVYRPIGEEWYTEGFWKIYDHPETVKQYLTLDQRYRPIDGSPPLNIMQPQLQEGVYYCQDIESDKFNKAITLEAFKEMDIDIVIASIPEHIEPFKELIHRFKPNAKLIYQVGNTWSGDYLVDNMMLSANVAPYGAQNYIRYHQEFDTKLFNLDFRYMKPTKPLKINSFINLLDTTADWPLFEDTESLRPEWEFRSYGGQCRDGSISGSANVAKKMQQSGFIWHVKPGGDGYGHVLFNAAACGKPLIVKRSYYEGKFGAQLLIPGETCIDIDGMNPEQIVSAIEFFSQPDRYADMSIKLFNLFKQVVNFNEEFIDIKKFLERLI